MQRTITRILLALIVYTLAMGANVLAYGAHGYIYAFYAYAIFFTIQLAVALVAIIVAHEQ